MFFYIIIRYSSTYVFPNSYRNTSIIMFQGYSWVFQVGGNSPKLGKSFWMLEGIFTKKIINSRKNVLLSQIWECSAPSPRPSMTFHFIHIWEDVKSRERIPPILPKNIRDIFRYYISLLSVTIAQNLFLILNI